MPLSSYEAAGVNVKLGDQFVAHIRSISTRQSHQQLLKGAGGYAAVYPVAPNRLIALTTDGVGTKVLLAHQLGQHHGIGIDLVAMCANDLICVGARPTLFLDYFATGKLELSTGATLIEGIVDGCDQAGMMLVGGETAEMPDVYAEDHYDLAGFAVGELAPEQLITGQDIQPGQTLIGLPSSGIHSNGLSLARKLATTEAQQRLLLKPTRIYVKPVLSTLETFPGAVTGIAHITGGGWRNLFRLNPAVGFEVTSPLPVPPVFHFIREAGISPAECYKTFNMGMGMVLIVSHSAEAIVAQLQNAGCEAQIVGRVIDNAGVLHHPEEALQLNNDSGKGWKP